MSQNAAAVSAEISTLIAGSSSSVRQAYVKASVDRELQAREVNLGKALDLLKRLKGEVRAIKPDNKVVVLDAAGNRSNNESWDPKTLEKKDKLEKQVQQFDEAITNYLSFDPASMTEEERKTLDPNKDPYKLMVDMMGKLANQKPGQPATEQD